jgi:hypothetical protein
MAETKSSLTQVRIMTQRLSAKRPHWQKRNGQIDNATWVLGFAQLDTIYSGYTPSSQLPSSTIRRRMSPFGTLAI